MNNIPKLVCRPFISLSELYYMHFGRTMVLVFASMLDRKTYIFYTLYVSDTATGYM